MTADTCCGTAAVRAVLFLFFFMILTLFSGCGSKTQIVLLPDPDGRVGKIEVANPRGLRVLDKPWEATEIASLKEVPGESRIMDEAQVKQLFKDALDARPQPPVTFLIYFKSESALPTSGSLETIPGIVEMIRSRRSQDISVVGHADSTGTADYNLDLSLRRAKKVAEILQTQGVDPAIIEIDYFGMAKPLIEVPDGVPEPRNRRVEVTVR